LRPFLEQAGELFPVDYNGQIFTVTNITLFLDALDYSKAEFPAHSANRPPTRVARYAFSEDALSGRALFKLSEDWGRNIYVVEDSRSPSRGFRQTVLESGLVGLHWRLLWSNDQEPIYCGTPWTIVDILLGTGDDIEVPRIS
jgi:hypothetical protein